MSPPTVRVNTFVQPTVKPYIDSISKIYIIGELLLGVNRFPVITKRWVYIIPTLIYCVVTLCGVLYIFILYSETYHFDCFVTSNMLLYIVYVTFSFIFSKRIHLFYNELNNFDIEVGCNPKFMRGSIKNIVLAFVVVVCILIVFLSSYGIDTHANLIVYLLPSQITQTLEVHYYGHLLNLLTPRLRLINLCMDMSQTKNANENDFIFNNLVLFKKQNIRKDCQMKKIMDLYNIIVKSYNYLIEAIKWQLLLTIISSFISVLGCCFHFSQKVIRSPGEHLVDNLITNLTLSLTIMIPLFAPCVFGDRVYDEVRRLRELLASWLYENKLDKSNRSIARTLLAYTETRNLSFTLLRILNIDISLPFKFVGLLATYLIILLQFEKVLYP